MIYTKPMRHQKYIVKFIYKLFREKKIPYAAIFADYGIGKTLTALMLIDLLPRMRKILIVSSKTAIQSTWPDEIRAHTNFKYVHLLGYPARKIKMLKLGLAHSYVAETAYTAESYSPTLFLINFDGVRNIATVLQEIGFDMIIIDESTKLKSPRALRTKVMWSMSRYSKYRIIMTGFPITEHLGEIYSQVKFLDMGEAFGNSYYGFLDKYFYKAGFKRILRRKAPKQIFKLIEPFAIRVTNDVLQLPPKMYQKRLIEPTKQQIELLSSLRDYFQLELGKVRIDTQYVFALINKSLQICDGFVQDDKGNIEVIDTGKDEALLDIVDDIDPYKNKILVWAVYRFSIRKLKKLLKKQYGEKFGVLTLTGTTEDVNDVVKKFQYKKEWRMMLATQKKAAESITLTSCKHAIYYSNSWSNDLRQNSEARIRRKGSEKHSSISYTDLVLNDKIEKLVYECLRKKDSLIKMLKSEFKNVRMK